MTSYSSQVHDAKDRMLREILKTKPEDIDNVQLARLLDELNKSWVALTDCLVRQRDERDLTISDLLNQLAETKKDK